MVSWGLNAAGDPRAEQFFARPVIYLDHWAVRRFADSPELGSRLVRALQARRGTWAVSLLNIMEFISVADQRHAVDFEALIDRMLPNVFFIELQAFDLMDRERALLEGGSRNAPYGGVELLRVFAHNMPTSPVPFTADGAHSSACRFRQRNLTPHVAQFFGSQRTSRSAGHDVI